MPFMRGPFYYENKEEKLVAHINEIDGGYQIEFEEDGERFATIKYPKNSITYVEDAAFNYISGLFKREDVLRHANKENEPEVI